MTTTEHYICAGLKNNLVSIITCRFITNLQDPAAVRSIRDMVRNIIAWSLGPRYELQQNYLRKIIDGHFAQTLEPS